jgi:hypothetical protein
MLNEKKIFLRIPVKQKRPLELNPGAFRFFKPGDVLLSHAASRVVPSTQWSLTAVFGMGTGVASTPSSPGNLLIF